MIFSLIAAAMNDLLFITVPASWVRFTLRIRISAGPHHDLFLSLLFTLKGVVAGVYAIWSAAAEPGQKRWENNDDLYTGEEQRYQLTTNETLAKPRCSGSTTQLRSHRRHHHAHGTCS